MIWLLFALNVATLWGAFILTRENKKLVEINRKLEIDNDLKKSRILDLEESNRELLEVNYQLTQKTPENET